MRLPILFSYISAVSALSRISIPPYEPVLVSNQHSLSDKSVSTTTTTSKDLSDIIAASPLLTLHRAICEIPSLTNAENAVGKLLVSYLEAHNFTVTTQKVPQPNGSAIDDARYNIIAIPRPSSPNEHDTTSGPKVLLSSHIDTVPPYIPYTLSHPSSKSSSRKETLISGRGTVDAKACVASQIHAVLSLLSSTNPTISPSSLGLVFVVGEERSGDGMRHFSSSALHSHLAETYSSVIFGEPTEGKLATGHKGVMLATLNAHGKAAHSGYPWLGRSANSMLISALAVLDGLGDLPEEVGGLPRSEKFGNSTVNVGLMQGGVAANVVAERAEAEVLMRLAGGSANSVKDIVRKAIKDVNGDIDVSFSQGYGPVELDAGVDGFDEFTVNYGTDVPNLETKKGVKRYLYGPGSILVAHGDNEGLTVGDLEESVEGYKRLMLHALGK